MQLTSWPSQANVHFPAKIARETVEDGVDLLLELGQPHVLQILFTFLVDEQRRLGLEGKRPASAAPCSSLYTRYAHRDREKEKDSRVGGILTVFLIVIHIDRSVDLAGETVTPATLSAAAASVLALACRPLHSSDLPLVDPENFRPECAALHPALGLHLLLQEISCAL